MNMNMNCPSPIRMIHPATVRLSTAIQQERNILVSGIGKASGFSYCPRYPTRALSNYWNPAEPVMGVFRKARWEEEIDGGVNCDFVLIKNISSG